MKGARIVIVSGLSGSGKTVALRAIEDCGYSCVDNLPPVLIGPFVETLHGKGGRDKIAIGVDVRERDFLHEAEGAIAPLRAKYDLQVIFLESSLDALLNRFKETRRPHPLSGAASGLEEAISMEKGYLKGLRGLSDRIIDTSSLTPHQLRHYIMGMCGHGEPGKDMHLTLMSFGFKNGAPVSADMVLDVRFLPNPHFIPELRGLTGLDADVSGFVMQKSVTGEFLERLTSFLDFLIPHYRSEGRAYLTVAIGCTGGRHRSVAIVDALGRKLSQDTVGIKIVHRDLPQSDK